MARVGLGFQISDAVLGNPPDVNRNTMLISGTAVAVTSTDPNVTMPFQLGTAYKLTSVADLTPLGITAANNAYIYKQVVDFYHGGNTNRSGTILWLLGFKNSDVSAAGSLDKYFIPIIRTTTVNSFNERPRTILFDGTTGTTPAPGSGEASDTYEKYLQDIAQRLFAEGIATVWIQAVNLGATGATTTSARITAAADLSTLDCPFVANLVVSDVATAGNVCLGRVGGWLSAIPVGQSIGDPTLGEFASTMYLVMNTLTTGSNVPCSSLSLEDINTLGDKQYLFTRPFRPKDGMYFNDGATCTDADNAFSTLEAVRTILAYSDDLRLYFTNYLNTRVPVVPSGSSNTPAQLDPTWIQTVLEGAKSQVSRKYIDNGDISDDSITLVAKDNDFLGTRTIEVVSSLLPAFTLRWVDGNISYVKNL